jgi:hypothetical protein
VSPLETWKALVCIVDSYPLSPPTGLQSARIMHFAEQVSLAKQVVLPAIQANFGKTEKQEFPQKWLIDVCELL